MGLARPIGSAGVNPCRLLNCGKTLPQAEKLAIKVHHVDVHIPKSRATEEHCNNKQVNQAAKMKVYQMDQDWQHKGELFLAWWVYDDSGNQGRDATSWAHDQGMDLTTDGIFQVIPDCETCAAIKQAKCQVLVIRGQWLKYKYGEAWHINYITHPQTHQARHYMLTIVDTTEWLEMYATAQSTILGTEKQVLW